MNIMEYCTNFYNFHLIPIYYYENGVCLYSASSNPSMIKVPRMVQEALTDRENRSDVYETVVCSYYGKIHVKETEGDLILGPVRERRCMEEEFQKFVFTYHIPGTAREAYENQFLTTPDCSLLKFHYLLSQLQIVLGGEERKINTYHDLDENHIERKEVEQNRQEGYEQEYPINIWEENKVFAPLVKEGNIEGILEYANQGRSFHFGEYDKDVCTNQKIIMIMSLTLTMEAAMDGGMPEAEAYLLAKHYIRKCLIAGRASEVDEISMAAAMDFVKRMAQYRDQKVEHTTIFQCIQYIRSRVYQPVKVKDVAEYSGYTEEHFSRLFKKETGFKAQEFIYNCKLIEAKHLLDASNLSVGEISENLYFSSQSHFQHRFKNKYGMTPVQYRNRQEK